MVPGAGIEPALQIKEADFKSLEAHSSSGNVRLVNSFISERKSRSLSPNTIKFYEGYLARFVTTLSKPLQEQTKQDILDFITSRDCNAGGKHAYFRVLRAFYKWRLSEDLVGRSPMANLMAPKVPKPLRPALSLRNLFQLLNASSNPREQLIVSLLADTGLRLSELAGIQKVDIDFQHQTVLVWGKGARQRLVAYGEASANSLQDYMKVGDRGEKLFNLLPRGIAQVLGRLEKKTGIKCNAHSFRRTFATESVRNGLNLFHVQSLLGNNSLTMTRVYAEQVDSRDAVKAYKSIVQFHLTRSMW